MNKILQLALIYAPNADPMATILTLAKKHTSVQITGAKIAAAKLGTKQHVDDKVMLFKCDVQSHGCGKSKPIILRDLDNPKICALCAKNRRRNLV